LGTPDKFLGDEFDSEENGDAEEYVEKNAER